MINDKNWQVGDIVYWVHKDGWEPRVQWGRIDEVFTDGLCVDYLEPCERRSVNGIPIDEFESDTHYRKLPNNWKILSSTEDLIKITYEPYPLKLNLIRYDDPEQIKEAYEAGLLVKASSIFKGEITTDITEKGYRVIKRYPVWYMSSPHRPNTATLTYDEAYRTYVEAMDKCTAFYLELQRQAALSDLEWSIEQIDKTLKQWKTLYGKTDEEYATIRNRILNMGDIENLEVRLADGCIQWKYWKNKKWHDIEN